ncbi:MAG: TetR/AcrR family transcriptional regulator, partial [Syntrophomonadaceae bacterium]|nr:TetR/AcrR family transcriptional regulator [Syntrophomonadaceae bacterium]
PVKEAIADEYVKQISKELAQETFSSLQRLPDTRSRLLAALNNAYGWVKFNPEITRIVLAYRFKYIYRAGEEPEKTGTQQVLAEILRAGQQAGEIKPDISVELMATYLDMLRGVMAWEWVNDTESFELSDRIAHLVDMVLYGISTSKESR